MPTLKSRLTHKLGPLPVWAWGGMAGVAGLYIYNKRKADAAAAADQSQGTNFTTGTDYGQIDPNTGVPYALEGAFQPAPFDSGGGGSSGGGGGFDIGGLLGDLGSLLQQDQPPTGANPGHKHPHGPHQPSDPIPPYHRAPHHHHHGPHHGPPVHPIHRVHHHPGADGGATARARFGGHGHGATTRHTPHAGTDRHGRGLHGGHHPSHHGRGRRRK